MKFAVIDIGTNSTLLLIAEKAKNKKIKIIDDLIETTRLGESLHKTGIISKDAAARTFKALEKFIKIARHRKVDAIKIVGTAAMRTAKNSFDLVRVVKNKLHHDIEIISEEEEARLTYESAAKEFGENIVVIDIGGGSTEIAYGHDSYFSFPIGCVLLKERFLKSDPPKNDEIKATRKFIFSSLSHTPSPTLPPQGGGKSHALIANAGTATTLGAIKLHLKKYDRKKVHGLQMSHKDLSNIIGMLSKTTLAKRKKIPGLMPKRADVIIPGALILGETMKFLKKTKVTISDLGVRWGVIEELMKPLQHPLNRGL